MPATSPDTNIIFQDTSIASGTPCQKARLQEVFDLIMSAKVQTEIKLYAGLENVEALIGEYHGPGAKKTSMANID